VGPPGGNLRKKSRRLRSILVLAAVAVIAVIAAGTYFLSTSSPDSASVGDCLAVQSFSAGSEPTKVDCSDPSANVKVAVRLESSANSCPDGDYDTYSVQGRDSYKLCLMIDAKEGDCFKNLSGDTDDGYQRVDCADPSAEAQFVKVVDGTDATSACDGTDADGAVTYSDPPVTLCMTLKGAGTS
jgi:hypothetical protein